MEGGKRTDSCDRRDSFWDRGRRWENCSVFISSLLVPLCLSVSQTHTYTYTEIRNPHLQVSVATSNVTRGGLAGCMRVHNGRGEMACLL